MSIESMNNIFQISINEKKLHRILSELQEAYKRHSSLISLLEIKMKRMEEKQEFSKNDVEDGQQKLQSQVENLAAELHSFPDYVSEAKLIEEVHKWKSEY
jgi:DNA-binding TFAR19-related protein (PDSD5 family)